MDFFQHDNDFSVSLMLNSLGHNVSMCKYHTLLPKKKKKCNLAYIPIVNIHEHTAELWMHTLSEQKKNYSKHNDANKHEKESMEE